MAPYNSVARAVANRGLVTSSLNPLVKTPCMCKMYAQARKKSHYRQAELIRYKMARICEHRGPHTCSLDYCFEPARLLVVVVCLQRREREQQ